MPRHVRIVACSAWRDSCDAVVLGCADLPLFLDESTPLLARAPLHAAHP